MFLSLSSTERVFKGTCCSRGWLFKPQSSHTAIKVRPLWKKKKRAGLALPRPVYVSPSDSLSAKVFFWSCSCVFLCPAPEIWFALRFLPAIFILIQFPSEWWREPLAISAPRVRAGGGEKREEGVCSDVCLSKMPSDFLFPDSRLCHVSTVGFPYL